MSDRRLRVILLALDAGNCVIPFSMQCVTKSQAAKDATGRVKRSYRRDTLITYSSIHDNLPVSYLLPVASADGAGEQDTNPCDPESMRQQTCCRLKRQVLARTN